MKEQYRTYLTAEKEADKYRALAAFDKEVTYIQKGAFAYLGLTMEEPFADDVHQDTMIKLIRIIDLEKLDTIKNMVGYVQVTIMNITRNQLSKNSTYKKYLDRLKEWIENTDELWRANYLYKLPQSEYILPKAYLYKPGGERCGWFDPENPAEYYQP